MRRSLSSFLLLIAVGVLFTLTTFVALAADTPPGKGDIDTPPGTTAKCASEGGSMVCLDNPLKAENITQLFQTIIDIAIIFAIPLVVFFIIYAGFLYVTARGNEGTIERAHKALLYALIGGLLILGANVLIQVVEGTVECVRDLEGKCSSS